jgi:hypothetical protein
VKHTVPRVAGGAVGRPAASRRPSASRPIKVAACSTGIRTAPVQTESSQVLMTNWFASGCQVVRKYRPFARESSMNTRFRRIASATVGV